MAGKTVGAGETVAQPVIAKAQAAGKARLLYLDNLRVGLITLVIVGHMAITYGAPLGDWYYSEPGEVGAAFAILTMLLLGIGSAFLLGLFYMIAGYLTPRPYDRKGAGPFIVDRLKRLGIPLLLYAVVINPLVTYWAAAHGGYQGAFLEYVPSHLPDLRDAAVGPLWFVEALLAFSILYALGRLLARAAPGLAPRDRTETQVPRNRPIALFALGLGLTTFLVRIWAPMGWWWEPLHQEPAHFPQYIALFAVGIIAYRRDWFARMSAVQARVWRWVALALVPVLPILAVAAGALSGQFDPAVAGGLTWLSLAYSLWEGFMGVAMVIITLVWFRSRFSRQGRLVGAMAGASYAVYVLHPLLIVPLALALSGIQLGLSLKFALLSPVAVALCFLVGYAVRKLPLVRNVL
ncbi:MAG: acyltransferase [Chloroflexi bacterium]|nr:acyltransferase [Chloroflexota bacterium]